MNSEIKSIYKVIVIGEMGVGKTSLVKRYVEQRFSIAEIGTVGVNFCTQDVEVDDRVITLQVILNAPSIFVYERILKYFQIWDTAGQERFACLSSCLYRGADCCILVFDVTSRISFQALDTWRDEFLIQACPRDPVLFPFMVLANKIDLDNRIVSNREVKEWCQRSNNIPYYETSAKNGCNLDLAFKTLSRKALQLDEDVGTLIFSFK
ncbi:hypothetical protein KR067_008649 [Drosophila pandora]|nr:hypothetical protein KR067_008649 [Drosophila pandora]